MRYLFIYFYRGAVWGSLNDYPQSTGHGIGAYLSVRECNLISIYV